MEMCYDADLAALSVKCFESRHRNVEGVGIKGSEPLNEELPNRLKASVSTDLRHEPANSD